MNAMATVRRTGTEFQYQLTIQKILEEGEEEILDTDDESETFNPFLIKAGSICHISRRR
jgi:hypothetical protein